MKCQEDLEENCFAKWQQVAFAFHAHLKRDHKLERILPAKAMMDNQAEGENEASHNGVTSQNIWKGYKNLFSMILRGFEFFYEKNKCSVCHLYYGFILQSTPLPRRLQKALAEKHQAYDEQKKYKW